MKKNNINYNKLLFEFLSVSFAVLGALLLNQWRENYNNGKLADKSIENIREELIENKEVVTELITVHKASMATVDSLMAIIEKEGNASITTESIEITLLSSSAWELTTLTKAVYYIDFEDVNNLAKVYNLQAYYDSIIKQYVLVNSTYPTNSDLESVRRGKAFLDTIIPLEESLSYYYEVMLEEVLEK